MIVVWPSELSRDSEVLKHEQTQMLLGQLLKMQVPCESLGEACNHASVKSSPNVCYIDESWSFEGLCSLSNR